MIMNMIADEMTRSDKNKGRKEHSEKMTAS